MLDLPQLIEAILFQNVQPMTYQRLATLTESSEDAVRHAVVMLKEQLTTRGVMLIHDDQEVLMVTHPGAESVMAQMRADAFDSPLSKASLETLAIIVYRGPIPKTEIDYIRGVNSSLVLRTLLTRGLIERDNAQEDKRIVYYRPTLDALSYIGISQQSELPSYQEIQNEFAKIHHESIT